MSKHHEPRNKAQRLNSLYKAPPDHPVTTVGPKMKSIKKLGWGS
jgi:hypothetical protein